MSFSFSDGDILLNIVIGWIIVNIWLKQGVAFERRSIYQYIVLTMFVLLVSSVAIGLTNMVRGSDVYRPMASLLAGVLAHALILRIFRYLALKRT